MSNALYELNGGGRAFLLNEDERNALRLRLDSRALVSPECLGTRAGGSTFRFIARGSAFDSASPYARSTTDPGRYLQAYSALVAMVPVNCDQPTDPEEPHARYFHQTCLRNFGADRFERFSRLLERRTPEQLLAETDTLGESNPLAGFSVRDVRMLRAYHAVLTAGSESEALARLRTMSGRMNSEEKLTLVQMFGERFRRAYDNERNAAGGGARGVVTFDQLLRGARHNAGVGFDFGGGSVGDAADFQGVCRDIASAQGRMLEALGFRHTYVISHAMINGDYHSTLVTQDPTQDRRVYRLDYGNRYDARPGDARALFRGPTDATLNYRVFRPGGAMVADVPSEFGRFMSEAAGFDVRSLDPLARTRSSITGVDVNTGGANPVQFRAGGGVDGMGARYVFAGMNAHWGGQGSAPGRVGLVLALQNRPAATFGQDGGRDLNLNVIYAQLEQRLRSPGVRLGNDLEARIEAQATAIFAAGFAQDGGGLDGYSVAPGAVSVQGDLRVEAGVRVRQRSWRDRFVASYYAGVQVVPGIADVRDNAFPQAPVPALSHFVLSAEGRLRLSQTPEGRAYLIAATTLLIDQLGIRGRAEAGIETDHFGATVQIEGRLTDSTAPYQDGTDRRIGAGISWNPSRFIRVSTTGSALLEGEGGQPGMGMNAMLTIRN